MDYFLPPKTLLQRPHFAKSKQIAKLLFNHMDAWVVSLTVGVMALSYHQAINGQTTLLLLAIGLGYWLAFALNDFYDAPFDAHDPAKARRNFFVRNPLSTGQVRAGLIGVGGFLLAVFAQFGGPGLAILALCLGVMWAYSAPPLRLKSRPGLDLLTHALFVETFPYLICLMLIKVTWTPFDRVMLVLTGLASLTAQLEQQARDFAVDSKTDSNFTTTVGLAATTLLLRLFTAVGLLIFFAATLSGILPWWVAAVLLIALPTALHRFTRQANQPRSERLTFLLTGLGLVCISLIFVAQLWG